ncbi:MAG: TRAP transporter small permease [Nitratireductor sp.]
MKSAISASEAQIRLLAKWTAIIGGIVLVLITAISVASITGRALYTMANLGDGEGWRVVANAILRPIGSFATSLGAGPVPGDYELVEAGTAFAVFAFLPWCHFNRGHAAVEILAGMFPGWLNRVIDIVSNLLMFGVALLIAWRLYLGMSDKMSYSETTLILQYPVWWSYAASMFGAVVFVIVSAWCLGRAIADFSDQGEYHASEAVH